jgi:acyl-CoA synthetase (AMP-forming)/AMP-acid ligase II
VPSAASRVDEAELRAYCKARLSSYKVPSAFFLVDALPVNATTGKLNRKDVAALLTDRSRPA